MGIHHDPLYIPGKITTGKEAVRNDSQHKGGRVQLEIYRGESIGQKGGNHMNLISCLMVSMDYNEKSIKNEKGLKLHGEDYGYALYESLEYEHKYLKNSDFDFRLRQIKGLIK